MKKLLCPLAPIGLETSRAEGLARSGKQTLLLAMGHWKNKLRPRRQCCSFLQFSQIRPQNFKGKTYKMRIYTKILMLSTFTEHN